MSDSMGTSNVLALLKIVSGMVAGANGKELSDAIHSGQVPAEDLESLAGLANDLQALTGRSGSDSSLLSSSSSSIVTESEDTTMLTSSASSLSGLEEREGEEDSALSSSEISHRLSSSLPRSYSTLTDDESSNSSISWSCTSTSLPSTRRRPLLSVPSSSSSSSSSTTQPPSKRSYPSSSSSSSYHPITLPSLPSSLLLHIFDFIWSGKPSYSDGTDGRWQLGNLSLVSKQWQDLAGSDQFWKPLCIARWPWLKSLKGGPVELLPSLKVEDEGKEGGREGGGMWRAFCLRNGRCMRRAGIGRRMSGGTGSGRAGREGGVGWGSQYTLSVEIFDRKGGFRLFCSYGQMSVMQQGVGSEGRWLTKLAVTGFASCWHFSAATRDPVYGRFPSIKEYFERAHEPGLDHCLCTEVTVMHKDMGKMAVLYASSKESRRRLTGKKNGTSYFEEDLRPATTSCSFPMAGVDATTPPSLPLSHPISYLAGSGMAISKVLPPSSPSSLPPSSSSSSSPSTAAATVPTAAAAAAAAAEVASPEEEKEQKYRVDRLYLIFSTSRRWDIPKIFEGLEWA